MSQTEALRERLVGKEYYFVSVEPAPVAGPFPQRAADSMSLSLTSAGGYNVRSPINSGSGGSFTLATADGDKTTITFGGAAWTERGLGRVSGDDANGTLKRRMEEAEDFLQARLSKAAGPYELELRDSERARAARAQEPERRRRAHLRPPRLKKFHHFNSFLIIIISANK